MPATSDDISLVRGDEDNDRQKQDILSTMMKELVTLSYLLEALGDERRAAVLLYLLMRCQEHCSQCSGGNDVHVGIRQLQTIMRLLLLLLRNSSWHNSAGRTRIVLSSPYWHMSLVEVKSCVKTCDESILQGRKGLHSEKNWSEGLQEDINFRLLSAHFLALRAAFVKIIGIGTRRRARRQGLRQTGRSDESSGDEEKFLIGSEREENHWVGTAWRKHWEIVFGRSGSYSDDTDNRSTKDKWGGLLWRKNLWKRLEIKTIYRNQILSRRMGSAILYRTNHYRTTLLSRFLLMRLIIYYRPGRPYGNG